MNCYFVYVDNNQERWPFSLGCKFTSFSCSQKHLPRFHFKTMWYYLCFPLPPNRVKPLKNWSCYGIRDLKIPWMRWWRERRKPGASWRRHLHGKNDSREKQSKIEQVGLSARLTREDKVMLSCFNSMTSFRKTREVLLDWYLNDLVLEEKFVLPAMTPVSLKKRPNFFKENLRVWSEFRLSAICCQTFSLSVVLDLALKRYGSVMRTSRTKARFWSSDRSIAELKDAMVHLLTFIILFCSLSVQRWSGLKIKISP